MKTKYLFYVFLLFGFFPNTLYSHGEELNIKYINRPNNYSIRVFRMPGTTLYDENFNALPSDHRANSKIIPGTDLRLNMIWSRPASTYGSGVTYDTIYYGKYQIEFLDSLGRVEKTRWIDLRDANYDGSTNFYLMQDFDVVYDYSGDEPVIYFHHLSLDKYGESYGIWDLEPPKAQNTSRFMNFQTKVTGLLPFFPVNITVGSTNYQVANDESVAIAAGFGTPQQVTVTAQNRKTLLPVVFGYRNFSSWKDRSGNIIGIFDTTMSTTMGGDLANLLIAQYKATDQTNTVTGPMAFNNKTYLTFTCNHTTVSGGTYAYDWWIKYDFNNTWQRLGGGLKTKSIMTTPNSAYSFYIKCFLKDYVDTVGVWSNDLRVEYYSFGDPMLAFKDLDDKTLSNAVAVNQITKRGSQTTEPRWPVNTDTLTAKQKLQILIPIKETVKEMSHKFRWKETDLFEPFDNERFFEETDGSADSDQELVSKTTENSQKEAVVNSTQQLSKMKWAESDRNTGYIPAEFAIHPNYPNPFNPSTTITFDIAKPSVVKLTIYNSLGQTVRSLYQGTKSEGRYDILWDGKNDQGVQVPSGVYIYRLEAGDFIQSRKMTLVK